MNIFTVLLKLEIAPFQRGISEGSCRRSAHICPKDRAKLSRGGKAFQGGW